MFPRVTCKLFGKKATGSAIVLKLTITKVFLYIFTILSGHHCVCVDQKTELWAGESAFYLNLGNIPVLTLTSYEVFQSLFKLDCRALQYNVKCNFEFSQSYYCWSQV